MYESSDEEVNEPILPRHDPNFIALEKDLNESAKQREISRKKALKLKDEANECVKTQKFRKAIRLYGEAIEECKSIMSLYTNRALCYLKINEYNNCIKDCERVIEYLEVFEDQMEDNKDLYAKALLRKSLALSKMKNFEEAIDLLKIAYDTVKEEELKKCLTNIETEYDIHKKALELLNNETSPENKVNFE
jgi:tetratricopeptide (TPR) repeat protein